MDRRTLLHVLIGTNVATATIAFALHARANGGIRKTLSRMMSGSVASVPGVSGAISGDPAVVDHLQKTVAGNKDWGVCHTEIPVVGLDAGEVIGTLQRWAGDENDRWANGKASGVVYHGGEALTRVISEAFSLYALSNPLHSDVFPVVRKLESEVISMTCRLFGGADTVGNMTSGGTESIMVAMLAHREWARHILGIVDPEVVVPSSAHAAFWKAGHYLGIKIVSSRVDPTTFMVDVEEMQRQMTANTIMLVASAPQFAHGVIDPVAEIGRLALKGSGKGRIGLHVDACLGSFVLPFSKQAGFPVTPYGFDVPGVTSMSCDTHKYGFAPKGSSVVMFHSNKLRHYMYFTLPGWSAGVYASATLPGSRSGAIVVGTWAALSHVGQRGYIDAARRICRVARRVEDGLRQHADFEVLGKPELMVVSFISTNPQVAIWRVLEMMSKRGWHLDLLQNPAAIRMCCTLMHCSDQEDMVSMFLDDLSSCAEDCKQLPKPTVEQGMSAIHGTATLVPEQAIDSVGPAYLDILTRA